MWDTGTGGGKEEGTYVNFVEEVAAGLFCDYCVDVFEYEEAGRHVPRLHEYAADIIGPRRRLDVQTRN